MQPAQTKPQPRQPRDEQLPVLLFTAFEPSGDDHASAVISELKSRHPDLEIYAWGGPKMAQAGAEVVERTGDDATMGIPGWKKIQQHREINVRVAKWLDEHPGAVLIPVDSPAANFPICKLAKKRGMKVVHLVAPQVWAWGAWRIRKLRRLTDCVLCLLPFEEKWFKSRGVPAEFIGHPLFDKPLDDAALDHGAADLPDGDPKIALMPGSRPAELEKNFPLLLAAFRRIRKQHPEAAGLVAATRPEVEERLRAIAQSSGGWPDGMEAVSGRADHVIRWCDLAVVVSGTVTLQIARQRKPMVIFFKANPWIYILFAKWVLTTEFFTLPNLVAGREIVPELVPHFAGPEPIAEAVLKLIDNPREREVQVREIEKIVGRFKGRIAAQRATDAIERVARIPQVVSV